MKEGKRNVQEEDGKKSTLCERHAVRSETMSERNVGCRKNKKRIKELDRFSVCGPAGVTKRVVVKHLADEIVYIITHYRVIFHEHS
jgi:hypothetical protein